MALVLRRGLNEARQPMILRIFSESFRKRFAAATVGNRGEFFSALGGNAQLHRWLKDNRPFSYFQHRFELYNEVQTRILRAEPIDYLEFGVRQGDSIFKWATLNRHSNSRFIGFDSFEGLPEDWVSVTGMAPKGSFSVGGNIPPTSDIRIRFIKGWFRETLRPFLREFHPRSRLVIHNDADLYSSTLYTLSTLDSLLRPGSILIFDEFANPLHEWRAFRDYSITFGRSCRILGAAGEYYTQIALELT
jgi:hypothetical protein